jgi:Cu-processing system ATP-binding protein
MISVKGVSKKYSQVQALNNLTLEILSGRVTGILGPNGCGKTTLIKSILGLVVPDRGQIEVDGHSIFNGWDYRQKIGYMPQNADFPGNLKINELFTMLEDIRQVKSENRSQLINLFKLENTLHRPFGELSGGTKQKVAVIAAFMFNPQILILDEPTVGLDPVAVANLKVLIKDASGSGRAVLLVTHMVSEIEQLVNEMFFVLEGELKFSGNLATIIGQAKSSNLEEAVKNIIEAGAKT